MLLISHFLIGRLSGPNASVIAYFLFFFEYSGMSSAQMVLAIGLPSIIAPKIVLFYIFTIASDDFKYEWRVFSDQKYLVK